MTENIERHREMEVIDLHCDMLSLQQRMLKAGKEYSPAVNRYHVDLEKLKQGDYLLQCFAIFVNPRRFPKSREAAIAEMDSFHAMLEQYPGRIAQVFSFEDILKHRKEGRISALLTIEDGGSFMDDPADLRFFHQHGVRIMSLTWNNENRLAWPNVIQHGAVKKSQDCVDDEHGLKPAGLDFLSEMERLGIVVDVSHLSDAGFREVCRVSKKPFIATHSNARAVCGHVRNLTDSMLRAIADHGGITGLNFCPEFLDPEEDALKCRSTCEWMVRHISHIRNTAGTEVIALGSDFDGISGNLELTDCSRMQRLADALRSCGFASSEIEKIFYKNALRFFQEVL